MTLDLLAYAKLNLSLRVIARRSDGFHELDSVVQTIDLADRISLAVEGSGITVENDLKGLVGRDLAERAAEAVLEAKGLRIGLRIGVFKGIPAGAGLGGGSSDAAAVVWGVDRLTPPRLPQKRLLQVAAKLGSDVPLFLEGGQTRMTGRGERLSAMDSIRPEHFVLLVPPVHCDTARVYGAWHRVSGGEAESAPAALGENDLLAPAVAEYPELTGYRDAVLNLASSYAGMSGSGSTFFAAYQDPAQAGIVAERLRARFPEARCFVCAATGSGRRML